MNAKVGQSQFGPSVVRLLDTAQTGGVEPRRAAARPAAVRRAAVAALLAP